MTAFGPQDHVTEREVGAWRDCTIAALLETFRLALPNGRDIPATEAEKERFRAAAGLPDDHPGVTIDAMLPAARRLYGLADDYIVVRYWPTIERLLSDADMVGVVTGRMGAVPVHLRRWDAAFSGPHAVAGRGAPVPIWCDPLAPKGTYTGEPVTLPTWRAFFNGLPGAAGFFMAATGGADGMINAGGVRLTSDKLARITKATDLLDAPGGKRIAGAPIGRVYPFLGTVSGHRAVLVTTAIPYPDHAARPTVCYVRLADATVEDAPAVPSQTTVTLSITGKPPYSITL